MRAPAPSPSRPGALPNPLRPSSRTPSFGLVSLFLARAGTPWRPSPQLELDSLRPAPLAPTVVTTLFFLRPGPSGAGCFCPCGGAPGFPLDPRRLPKPPDPQGSPGRLSPAWFPLSSYTNEQVTPSSLAPPHPRPISFHSLFQTGVGDAFILSASLCISRGE